MEQLFNFGEQNLETFLFTQINANLQVELLICSNYFSTSYQHFESLDNCIVVRRGRREVKVTNGFSRSMFLQSLTSFFIYVIIRSSRQEESRKKGVLRNFAKFIGKHLCQRSATLLKKRLWHRGFTVNFAKFLRTAFLTELLRWLLLYHVIFDLLVISY